jgi:hypothetical protein
LGCTANLEDADIGLQNFQDRKICRTWKLLPLQIKGRKICRTWKLLPLQIKGNKPPYYQAPWVFFATQRKRELCVSLNDILICTKIGFCTEHVSATALYTELMLPFVATQIVSGRVFARFAASDIQYFNATCGTFMHTLKAVSK